MEECELCGAKTNDIYIVDVEDVELRVCAKCSKGKKIVSKIEQRQSRPKQFAKPAKAEEAQLVENYGIAIHNARESMRLPLKVLAEMINEKETLLLRIEQQRTLPSIELTKKLEKALRIKLAETAQPQGTRSRSIGSGDRITIADYMKKKDE